MHAQAQLANTKWKTTFQMDQPLNVIFNFTADTLSVTNSSDYSNLETMTYTTQDTVLTLKKLYGQSECDTAKGIYAFKITGNEMHLGLISDSCSHRAMIINDIKLTKAN